MLNRWIRNVVLIFPLMAAGCTNPPAGGGSDDNGIEDIPANVLALFEVVVDSNHVFTARIGDTSGQQFFDICDGWFPLFPNHTLTINSGLGMSVSASASGGAEPRLWIQCGQSNFCGQETSPGVWEISRFWSRAVCDVYVGTASEAAELNYALEFVAE